MLLYMIRHGETENNLAKRHSGHSLTSLTEKGIEDAKRAGEKLKGIAFSLFIGGGIGNMVERIFNGDVVGEGLVTDFIDFCAFPNLWRWVFNIADSAVCVGTFMLSAWLIVDTVKAYKLEKAQKEKAE